MKLIPEALVFNDNKRNNPPPWGSDRCGKAMACEQFYGSQEHFWGWRCIFCGEIIDDVIIENRQWLNKGIVSGNKKAQSILGKKY